MKFKVVLLFFFNILMITIQSESSELNASSKQARYDNYRIYYVYLENDDHVKLFQKIEERSDSYTFIGHARHPKQYLLILVAAHKIAEMHDILETFSVDYEILNYNLQKNIDDQMKTVKSKNTPAEQFDWDHYFHLDTIYAWMEKLEKTHEFISIIEMGNSTNGIPIKGIKIAKNLNNTSIFIESGIHAREWIAPATATYIINELLTSNDSDVQKLTINFNWLIFPVINPDGYVYTFEKDRMWRKNRNLFDNYCWGVDLNRNYPFHWNEIGSSSDPCRYDFAGNSPASEIETKNLMEFVKNHVETDKIKTYIALHSYSQLIMFPYGYTPDKVDNYDDLKMIGIKASEKIKMLTGKEYKSGSIYETIYPSSGGSKDWAHGVLKIPITYTFELRGLPNNSELFILPAEQIRDTGKETFGAFMTIINEAQNLGYYN